MCESKVEEQMVYLSANQKVGSSIPGSLSPSCALMLNPELPLMHLYGV